MKNQNDDNNSITTNFETDDSRFIAQRRSNIKSDLIEITEDKLENILLKHLKRIGNRNMWLTPLTLCISVTLASVSATFNERFSIPANMWESLFFCTAIVSGIWFLVSLVLMVMNWKKSSIEYLISTLA